MLRRPPTGGVLAAATLALLAGCDFLGGQAAYDSPEQAGEALLAAVQSGDTSEMLRVLGKDAQPVVESGDPIDDADRRSDFIAEYAAAHHWVAETPEEATLRVGDSDWPFPFPLVKGNDGWRFDTSFGIEEILDRRIGENELAAIQASLAYVDAQREYYWWNPDGEPMLHYARTFVSTPGQKDGLFWETSEDEAPSPLGELFAAARAEGYLRDSEIQPAPYYGYHFHMLTAQGEHAAGGAYDYVVDDRMIGGFGLVAYPAERGVSGVMTFIVNHDGIVFSKDLGPDTEKLATAMTTFDPDDSWKREEIESP
ncbi:MAG TPA: DUF2950 domain-containing protein [Gammaproteobacteria bacterium]